jgi:chitosanase
MWAQKLSLFATLASAATLVLASPANLEKCNVGFAADPSINARGILSATKASAAKGKDILATFKASSGPKVPIFGDWLDLDSVSAYHWVADMQVDCDGVDVSFALCYQLGET